MIFFGYIFYIHTVVGGVVNCINDIYGGGIHRTRSYRYDCVGIQFIKIRTAYRRIQIYDLLFDVCVYSYVFFLPRIFSFIKSVIYFSFFPLTGL